MKVDGLFQLKRRWLPLFILGAALLSAGLALGLLWLYRESPRWVTDNVVDLLTPTSPNSPPRGTLISATALTFILLGGCLLAWAVRQINASEVGAIDSFWWKVAVGMLAGQWWLGQPRLVVLAAGPQMSTLLRALKTISNQITVLGSPTPELVLALADDEAAVQKVLERLKTDLDQLSDGLRLRGRFLALEATPLLAEALARADSFVWVPSLDSSPDFGLTVPDSAAQTIRLLKRNRILIGCVTASQPGRLAEAVEWCTTRFGSIDQTLSNGNVVQPLPPGRYYQTLATGLTRDLSSWSAPEQWDAAKLAVFLREALGRH